VKPIRLEELRATVDLDLVRQSLGGPEAVPAEMADRLAALAAELLAASTPQGCVVFATITSRQADRIQTADGATLHGLGIAGLLRRCDELAAFAVSLGPEPERLMQQATEANRLVDLTLLDAIASEAVEDLAEQAEGWVRARAAGQERAITRRHSPGYCDWSLEDQTVLEGWGLFAPTGIRLTPARLMLPEKSISAVIGIGGPETLGRKLAQRPDCRQCAQADRCPGYREP
jgi:hypothetical protein